MNRSVLIRWVVLSASVLVPGTSLLAQGTLERHRETR